MKYVLLIIFTVAISGCGDTERKPQTFNAKIFLSESNSAGKKRDIKYLKEFPYAVDVIFVSKEEAKKQYRLPEMRTGQRCSTKTRFRIPMK
jgi:hypothetical protein